MRISLPADGRPCRSWNSWLMSGAMWRARIVGMGRSIFSEKAFIRALELLDLTIGDDRWKGRRKELTRVRELLCDAMFGGSAYGSDLASLDRYFFHFAVAARAGR